jgi:hypothetical protein
MGQIIPEEAFQQLPSGLVIFCFPTDSSQYKFCPILPRNILHLRLSGQVPEWWKSTPCKAVSEPPMGRHAFIFMKIDLNLQRLFLDPLLGLTNR